MNIQSQIEQELSWKLEFLRVEYESKVAALKREYADKLYATGSGTKRVATYTLLDSSVVDEMKESYKRSSRFYYYSYNTLIQKYTDAFRIGKRNGSVRWFRQAAVWYPDKVNQFLDTCSGCLLDDYHDILLLLGYVVADNSADVEKI